jgi:hypothetical protein
MQNEKDACIWIKELIHDFLCQIQVESEVWYTQWGFTQVLWLIEFHTHYKSSKVGLGLYRWFIQSVFIQMLFLYWLHSWWKRKLHSNTLHIYDGCCQSWKPSLVAHLPFEPPCQLACQFVRSCNGTRCYLKAVFHYWWLMIRCLSPRFKPSFPTAESVFWPFAIPPSLYQARPP